MLNSTKTNTATMNVVDRRQIEVRNGELIGGGVVGTILRGTNRLTRTNLLWVIISDKDKHLVEGETGEW